MEGIYKIKKEAKKDCVEKRHREKQSTNAKSDPLRILANPKKQYAKRCVPRKLQKAQAPLGRSLKTLCGAFYLEHGGIRPLKPKFLSFRTL